MQADVIIKFTVRHHFSELIVSQKTYCKLKIKPQCDQDNNNSVMILH